MSDDYEFLNLKEWPFRVVPSFDSASVWVGRPVALKKFLRIARRAGSAAAAELILLWAGFGAGKTHALRYLENLARQDPKMMPLYVATPKGARSFADLYATIIDAVIESGALEAAGRDLFDRTKGNISSDLERAVIRIAHYAPEDARTAMAWLRGDKVYLKDLRDIGIGARIENSQDAVRALNALIRVLQRDGNVTVLLLVDEVQELGELTDRQLDECIGGFQKVFNQNENGLTLLMSFTSASQATLKRVIGEALYDRAGQTLTLAPLEHQEAVDFLNDLLQTYAIDELRAPWPFTADALEAVVDHVERQEAAVSPRAVIKAADLILKDAALDIEDAEIDDVSREYAEAVLSSSVSGLDD